MYDPKSHYRPSPFVLAAAITLVATQTPLVAAFNPADYPPMDMVPPVNSTWSNKFLPAANVPAIPVSSTPITVTSASWVQDVTTCSSANTWGVSFDGGPTGSTKTLLDSLKSMNIKATFFVTGSRALGAPDLLYRAYNEGHQIGLMTWSQPHLSTLTNDQIVAEMFWSARIVREVTGVTPRFFRPPYGEIDARIRAIVKGMGMIIVEWSVDSMDTSPGVSVANVFKTATVPGATQTATATSQSTASTTSAAQPASSSTASQSSNAPAGQASLLPGPVTNVGTLQNLMQDVSIKAGVGVAPVNAAASGPGFPLSVETDSSDSAVAQVPAAMDAIMARGFTPTTVSACLNGGSINATMYDESFWNGIFTFPNGKYSYTGSNAAHDDRRGTFVGLLASMIAVAVATYIF